MFGLFSRRKPLTQTTLEIGHIKGQHEAKLALLLSAIGRHNLLMIGPPGEGKTHLASSIVSFLPKLSRAQRIELDNIYGEYPNVERPFQVASPSITLTTLIGGGHNPTPGLITKAHNGVLFIDELAEHDKRIIDSLRAPMNDRQVFITRKGITKRYRCDFQLIAAMNPCFCGYNTFGTCKCTAAQLRSYANRISGPIMDRIDIHCRVYPLHRDSLHEPVKHNQSQEFKEAVANAIKFADITRSQTYQNYAIPSHHCLNPQSDLINWSALAFAEFTDLYESKRLSTRQVIKMIRLLRTVADMHYDEQILQSHVNIVRGYL